MARPTLVKALLVATAFVVAAPSAATNPLGYDGATEVCDGFAVLAYAGPACPRRNGWVLLGPDGTTELIHGLDPASDPELPVCLTDLDGDGWPEPGNLGGDGVPGAGSCPPERTPICTQDGTEQRVELVYMVPSDRSDRYEEARIVLARSLALSNGALWREADAFGYTADLRSPCADGQPSVHHVQLDVPNTEVLNRGIIAVAMDLGFTDARVKYVLSYEGSFRAYGTLGDDDSLGPNNQHNRTVGYAVVPYGLDWETLLHELGHTLGAVQASSPHSTRHLGHCLEGGDYMCYDDRVTDPPNTWTFNYFVAYWRDVGTRPFNPAACPDREYFDCGHDDYFHPDPPAGSYLASQWNLAHPFNGFVEVQREA